MANDFFTASGNPATGSQGSSSTMRAEFEAIEDGFDKLPTLTGNGGKLIKVNSGGTALETLSGTTGTGDVVLATSPTITSPTLVTPALGTPASGVVTNLTGTASININGTVGATTPTTGAFTTVTASGQITGADGTAGAPSYSFSSSGNTDNGMYLSAANEVSWATAGTKRLTVTSDGRLYGAALHNNAGAVTGTTNQYIASGTYTPTATGGTEFNNFSFATTQPCQWMRVGNVVTVSGRISVTASATGQIDFLLSLPIASTFSNSSQCCGVGSRWVTSNISVSIQGSGSSALFLYNSPDTLSTPSIFFTFTYVVL